MYAQFRGDYRRKSYIVLALICVSVFIYFKLYTRADKEKKKQQPLSLGSNSIHIYFTSVLLHLSSSSIINDILHIQKNRFAIVSFLFFCSHF